MTGAIFCTFSSGRFTMPHPNGLGKQTVVFEDSDRFGPANYNQRFNRLSEMSPTHKWFWSAYELWHKGGRQTKPGPLADSLPICVFPKEKSE